MAENLSPEEFRADLVAHFPEGVGELLYHAQNEVSLIHLYWNTFRTLFMDDPDAEGVLDLAGGFFRTTKLLLQNEVLLRICRLIEDGPQRASLHLLIKQIRKADPDFARLLASGVQSIVTKSKPIEAYRNNLGAHAGVAYVLGQKPNPLSEMTYGQIGEICTALGRFVNTIEGHFNYGRTEFAHVIEPGGAESLLIALRQSKESRQAKRDELDRRVETHRSEGQ